MSTPTIPQTPFPADTAAKEGRLTRKPSGGSLLDAKTAPQGVNIAREFTPSEEPISDFVLSIVMA